MASMTNVSCKWCKTPFQARTADVKRGWGKFCSKSCKASEQEKRTGQNMAFQLSRIYSEPCFEHAGYGGNYDSMHERALEGSELGWDAHKD
ncbi:TPA: hypothetical protein JH928_003667 [Acinetobacter baumannii]|uniref:hypothetical protein n=1 Tax=Acinetobacter baumannii TaxID=470 RepID=UPI00190237A0|nr:hypothetical protein [Acinetobacter baumannii]MBJ9481199.1 hypothetical protein [Acinetobacter baumannii]MBJ9910075.1 hypothetical protein [Acinetobacter baumannii]MBJ9944562.1 hypothetical protein [Acinetobacter baumannii]HAV3054112.1 hypothetical protein [Acinetobacter baumannii]HAV5378545.1 hypothetical protein [Acinetobacter baumannii]